MKKYVCGVCGYVYDPAKGDSDGILPEECPVCGARKEQFVSFD